MNGIIRFIDFSACCGFSLSNFSEILNFLECFAARVSSASGISEIF